MKDLIYRQDAIKLFSERKNELGGIQGDLGGAMSGAVKLIESLPSAQQWIPVSEGAPKENGKYLVSVEKSEWDGTTRRSVRTMTYNKREVAPFQWGHYEIYSGKVTAWMDLPEPYKGGDVE